MPTETYQFYIAPGSTNVSITAALFGVGGVTLDTETTAASVATGNWEPFSVARSEIGALSAGQVIDFGTRKFAASFSDHEADGINLTSQSQGISGGRFSMGKTATWVDVGGGVYAADHDFSAYRNPMLYIVDENASSKPKMAVDPAGPEDMDPYRFVFNGNWFIVNNSNNGVDNGVVHTVGGDNNSGSVITGWTITDAGLKSQVNDLLAGVTTNADAGPWTLIHSSANTVNPARITYWDNSTGGLTLESFGTSSVPTYSGTYLEFALCGLPGQTLENGEYMLDFTQGVTTGRVLYKPTNGNASDGRIPVSDFCFRIGGAGNTHTFNNVTIEGQASISSAPGAIRDQSGGSACTITNCTISDGSSFFRINYTPITVDKCSLKRSTARAGAMVAGTTMTNNVVFHIEGYSGFLIQCQDGVTAVPHTYFADNVLSLEASTHGQGMSLYKDAWRNATVVHNIFYNCQRAHSFQPGTSQRPNTEFHEYKFENNLVVVDKVLDIQGFAGGQQSISFNGAIDTGLSGSDGAQSVSIRNNTVVLTSKVPSTFSLQNRKQLTAFDLDNLKHSSVVVDNNIAASITASDIIDQNGGHTHANNLVTQQNTTTAISLTDKVIHQNMDDYLEVNTFQGKTVAGGAADGGALGIRWSTIPTSTQIQSIITNDDVNWATSFPALTLPVGGQYSNATGGKQEYGVSGGGTGDLGPWSAANASWTTVGGGGVFVGPEGAEGIMGASGWIPGNNSVYCSPDYTGNNIMFTWDFSGLSDDRDRFLNGISADYFRLQITVTDGGSADNSAGGYYAGNTGQQYNYYWWPGTIETYTSDALRWRQNELGTGSDEWPTAGVTGSLWGTNPHYTLTFSDSPFPEAINTYTFTYSITHDNYGD